MLLKYLLFPLLLLNNREKSESTPPVLSAAELLMNKKWVLTSYGFDENRNGRIDSAEELIEECETDDTVEFNKGGTGIISGNFLSCCNGPDEQTFQWQFADKGNSLVLFGETVSITKLTTRELVTYRKFPEVKGQFPGLITVYKLRN